MNKSIEENIKEKIVELKNKADHNKSESLWIFKLIMLSTLTSPVLVAFGKDEFLSKILPSILSLVAAALTAWIQLRKPQNLWKIYRTAQRKMQTELECYQFKIKYYSNEKRDEILFERTNEIYMETHEKWANTIPKTNDLKKISKE